MEMSPQTKGDPRSEYSRSPENKKGRNPTKSSLLYADASLCWEVFPPFFVFWVFFEEGKEEGRKKGRKTRGEKAL